MNLNTLLWNLQDFYIFMDYYRGEDLSSLPESKWQLLTTSFKSNKPLDKILAIKDLILNTTLNLDLIFFTEVGGRESLDNFNQYFLDNQFDILHFDSNSDRGIDLGILVRKDSRLDYKTKFYNHRDFARGLHEIMVKSKSGKYIHFYLTHLKSKLNLKGKDFEGRTQREREVLRIEKIIQNNSKDDHHHIVCGDLNGIIYKEETEPELGIFANKMGLIDALEYLNTPHFERTTYLYYNSQQDANHMQLDYFLLSESLKENIAEQTQILEQDGNIRTSFPKDLKEKFKAPSDHYPYYLQLRDL